MTQVWQGRLTLLELIIDYLFEDFEYGYDEAKPKDGGTIEAYEFRADCFTYDEIDGYWYRHRRNRKFIVEGMMNPKTQKPYPNEYYDRYFDQMSSCVGDDLVSKLQAAFGAKFQRRPVPRERGIRGLDQPGQREVDRRRGRHRQQQHLGRRRVCHLHA